MWIANMWCIFFFFFAGGGGWWWWWCGDYAPRSIYIPVFLFAKSGKPKLRSAWVNPAWLQNLCSQLGLGKGANTISWPVPRVDAGEHNQGREREEQLELCSFLCWDTRGWSQAQSLKQLAQPHSSLMCYSSNWQQSESVNTTICWWGHR